MVNTMASHGECGRSAGYQMAMNGVVVALRAQRSVPVTLVMNGTQYHATEAHGIRLFIRRL